jgi:hypothetical protein
MENIQAGTKMALLAKRGSCWFSNKTKNAQQLGADLLIVYNNEYQQ